MEWNLRLNNSHIHLITMQLSLATNPVEQQKEQFLVFRRKSRREPTAPLLGVSNLLLWTLLMNYFMIFTNFICLSFSNCAMTKMSCSVVSLTAWK